jgi:hypothetical protein
MSDDYETADAALWWLFLLVRAEIVEGGVASASVAERSDVVKIAVVASVRVAHERRASSSDLSIAKWAR